jgi:hypothetical protein
MSSSATVSAPVDFLDSFGVNTKILLLVAGCAMAYITVTLLDIQSNRILSFAVGTAPVWLPIVTFLLFFEHWLYYVKKEYVLLYGRTTLEIRLPQEIYKSPEAMELILNQMYQTASPDNHKETYIDGKHPPTFSLEIVSRGGDVKFYINLPKKRFKDLIEAQLYAHYPGIEVHELEIDYTAEVPWDPKRFTLFSFHFGLKEADALPIRTYIEYGMHLLPKEEEKIDPINSIIEAVASIDPREFMWIQILIEANTVKNFKRGSLFKKPDWKKGAREHINGIIKKAVERSGAETTSNVMMLLTESERDTIKAIERSLSKNAFNTAIRGMYICPVDAVRIGDLVPRMITALKIFDDNLRNSIGIRWRTDFDWPWWQDPKGKRRLKMKRDQLNYYKRRYYQAYTHDDLPKVMTVEELATVYHFPGKVAGTPSLSRIPSKRSEAPANLPV